MFCKFKLLKFHVSQCFFLIFCLSSLSMIFAHESNKINESTEGNKINESIKINHAIVSPLILLKSNNNASLNSSNNVLLNPSNNVLLNSSNNVLLNSSNNVSLNFSNNISNQRYILLQKHIDTTISLKPRRTDRFLNLIVFKTWFLNGFIKFFIISIAIALARQQHQPQQQSQHE